MSEDLSMYPKLVDYPDVKHDPKSARHAKVMMIYEDRTLLGDVRAVRSDGKADVSFFSGKAWPIKPLLSDLYVIACGACFKASVEERGDRCNACAMKEALVEEASESAPDPDPFPSMSFDDRLANARDEMGGPR
jgi:hypothetical protein